MNNKGISPVIATILLVALVVASASVIFIWMKGFVKESITIDGKNVELVCNEINIQASYDGEKLYVANNGNVKVSGLNVKITRISGEYFLKDIGNFEELNPGEGWSGEFGIEEFDNIILIPKLIGINKNGKETVHICEENQGFDVVVN